MSISKKTIAQLESHGVKVVGADFRGGCPKERIEQINFISWVRLHYPSVICFHPVNEGDIPAQKRASLRQEGMLPGASDLIILHKTKSHPFAVIEMKRQDATKSRLSKEQFGFLVDARNQGAFCAVACGFEAAKEAFLSFIND